MASPSPKIHALIIPFMSQSHIIPMIDLSILLAQRGITVTIALTPLNATRYKSVLAQTTALELKVQLVLLPFPCSKAGLPEGCENLDMLPFPDLEKQFFLACNLLQEPLENYLEKAFPKPHCIISSLPCTPNIACKFNIPRFGFQTISCFTLLCSHNMIVHNVHEKVMSETQSFMVPDVPDKIEFTNAQLPKMIRKGSDSDMKIMIDRLKEVEASSEGVLVNTFEELELEYVKGYQRVAKNVLCIGPLFLHRKSGGFYRGHKVSIDDDFCLRWLDSMKPRSVIYVCFGSLCHLLPKQLIELGLGLEASQYPFIWIIREGDYNEDIKKWLLDEKFEERVKGRGLVIKGWAPQLLILVHQAVAGFLTHCGWNSTMEGLCAGLPMITWPMFAEQFYNEKLIVKVLKIGVRIGVEKVMQWGEEENDGVYVTRKDVKTAIESLMSDGKEGKERRRRAQELGKKAKRAMEDGGSSHLNITNLIQHIIQLVSQRENMVINQ